MKRPWRGPIVVKRIKYQTIPLSWIVGIGIPLITFGGGIGIKFWTVADSIATKAELIVLREDMIANFKRTDETIAKTFEASKKYTEDRAAQVKEEAISHSDQNKLKMDSAYSDVSAKVSLMLSILEQDRFERRKR